MIITLPQCLCPRTRLARVDNVEDLPEALSAQAAASVSSLHESHSDPTNPMEPVTERSGLQVTVESVVGEKVRGHCLEKELPWPWLLMTAF